MSNSDIATDRQYFQLRDVLCCCRPEDYLKIRRNGDVLVHAPAEEVMCSKDLLGNYVWFIQPVIGTAFGHCSLLIELK